ncbi:multi-tm2 domain protein [Paenibacillus sp. UMB7766-LJ446]|uniref:multi-tm2 domain protein n=1 Tax=Paenibacillus sp. UMB7766-LJ446 TaxID=3046313 RepID=UPI00254EF661|nr:multi-tm2 domain protein [Paenibacillus sp. UMB7766-LJ446]MDK8194391.1 multi-tm2 domain protein [Paenibacillus sp. UMB7766-LJ446]
MTTVQSDRNKLLAFLLNLIPGLGFLYWGRPARAVIYPLLFFGTAVGSFMLAMLVRERELMILGAVGAIFFWCVSMLDMVIVLLRAPSPSDARYHGYGAQYSGPHQGAAYPGEYADQEGHLGQMEMDQEGIHQHQAGEYGIPQGQYGQPLYRKGSDSERFFTILLSFVPGLGHLHLGLLHRGLSFLIAFFGSFAMMVFVASITNESVFLMFLLILPVIWVYCMFDAVQHVHRKQAGEVLQDRTLFEELEMGRASGRRSKVLATLLSAFPGAGHLYLGLQKRGMQLMFLFLGSIYILDLLRLSVFLFMIPLIWFYSFFDGLQCSSRYGREPLTDQPIFKDWARHQRLIGFGIAALGLYYLVIRLVIPQLNEMFPNVFMTYEIRSYVNTVIVSLLLIFGGLKLLFGKQRGASVNSAVHRNEEGADSLFLFKDRDDRL